MRAHLHRVFVGFALALIFVVDAGADVASESTSAAAFIAGDQLSRLDAVITELAQLRDEGGWAKLPDGPELVPGSRHSTVRPLRQRLRVSGDFDGEMEADPLLFDLQLANAVSRFQNRHGLRPNEALDTATRVALDVPVELRLRQLKDARAAWAALKPREAGRRVWVNIPEAVVVALHDAEIDLALRAVVGQPKRPTPTLSSEVTRVILNPSWYVPYSIAVRDLLPRQQDDPGFFTRKNIRVIAVGESGERVLNPADIDWKSISPRRFPYQLRQSPGPDNSLGRFKFDFANPFNVYLHDTPAPELLELSLRSLSSGCVRLENPAALAEWLLTDTAAKRYAKLSSSIEDNRTHAITLTDAVPIDMVYLTAWVTPDGDQLQFRRDIYRLGTK